MTEFERAERWMNRVCDWFRARPPESAVGIPPGPARVQCERAVRLLVAAAKKRDRAACLPVRSAAGARDRARSAATR